MDSSASRRWFWPGLLSTLLLVACGSGGGGGVAEGKLYWVTALTGLGFNNDTVVVNRVKTDEVYLSSSDGRLDDTKVAVTSATESAVSGTVTFSKQAPVTVSLAFTDTTVGLTLAQGTGQAQGNGRSTNPWPGSYTGTYTGDAAGTWTATVAADGKITVSVDGGSMTGTGTLDRTGGATMNVGGTVSGDNVTSTYTGGFKVVDDVAQGTGTWSNNQNEKGNWTGSKNTG